MSGAGSWEPTTFDNPETTWPEWAWPGLDGPGPRRPTSLADHRVGPRSDPAAGAYPALIGIFTAFCSVSSGIGTRTVSTPLS